MKTLLYTFVVLAVLSCGAKRSEESAERADTTIVYEPAPVDTSIVGSVQTDDHSEIIPNEPIAEVPPSEEMLPQESSQQQQVDQALEEPVRSKVMQGQTEVRVLPKTANIKKASVNPRILQVGTPRKLSYYEQSGSPYYEGQQISIGIELQNENNKFIKGQKEYAVDIQVQGIDSKYIRNDSLKILPGEGSTEYVFTIAKAGIYKVICSNKEVQPAEWFLKVMPSSRKKINFQKVPSPEIFRLAQVPHAVLSGFVQSVKRIRADGIDAATITFFLQDPDNVIDDDDSVKVLLSNGASFYVREDDSRSVSFVHSIPATVKVKARCLNSNVKVNEDEYVVRFYPAIDRYKIIASPSQIDLLQNTQITVVLLDKLGGSINTEEDLDASLFIESVSGAGILDPSLLKISNGAARGSAMFLPTGTGELKVKGIVNTLPEQPPLVIKIMWPVKVTLLTILGGLIGAFVSHLVARKKKLVVTLVVGAVMGFVFFWIVLSLGLANISQAIVLNQLSVVVLGIAGGWLGADTMKLLLKKLGVEL